VADDPGLPTPPPPSDPRKLREKARDADEKPRLLAAAQMLRRILPGDAELGDPLSTAGDRPSHVVARRVSEAAAERPSVTRELSLGALQVWQSLSEAQGRGRGEQDLAILFTDLVDFSKWALEAGDEAVLELLREMSRAAEPPITERRGKVVKRLGDGLMAVFPDTDAAVESALEACRAVGEIEVAGHTPELRAGVHFGRPRRIGGDYIGVDVNIAARVMSAAGGGEVLVSDATGARLDPEAFTLKPRRWFRAKGAPKDLNVFTVKATG
jgi:adenylate cyclase